MRSGLKTEPYVGFIKKKDDFMLKFCFDFLIGTYAHSSVLLGWNLWTTPYVKLS